MIQAVKAGLAGIEELGGKTSKAGEVDDPYYASARITVDFPVSNGGSHLSYSKNVILALLVILHVRHFSSLL